MPRPNIKLALFGEPPDQIIDLIHRHPLLHGVTMDLEFRSVKRFDNEALKQCHLILYFYPKIQPIYPKGIQWDIHQFKSNHPEAPILLINTTATLQNSSDPVFLETQQHVQCYLDLTEITREKQAHLNEEIAKNAFEIARIHRKNEALSIYETAKNNLLAAVKTHCSNIEYTDILSQLKQLEDQLTAPQKDIEAKTTALHLFQKNTHDLLGNSHSSVMKAVFITATAAAVTLLTWFIGFSVGFAFGVWMGPGAFISGLMAGQAAAVGITTASGAAGFSAAGATTYGLFKKFKATHEIERFSSTLAETIALS